MTLSISWSFQKSRKAFYWLPIALRADARPDSRPLINKQNNDGFVVESPLEVTTQFDVIAYRKGGAVNRMVIHAMEEARWQNGMSKYLRDNQYENVDGQIYFRLHEILFVYEKP